MRERSDRGAALVVLAAGGSIRMGQPKQLLSYRGMSLLRHAAMAALASRCRPVCIVLGNGADRLEREVADLPVVIAANGAWATGMASSIRTGLATVLEAAPHTDAVVLTLCDQPLVTAELLDGLVHEWHTTGRSIVACNYGDGRGAPALFARSWFGELARLTGDIGAKAILRTHPAQVALVPFPGGAIDVDFPSDYARLTNLAADVPWPSRGARGGGDLHPALPRSCDGSSDSGSDRNSRIRNTTLTQEESFP